MGTIRDWIEVAVLGIFWAGSMLLWTTRKRDDAKVQWPRSIQQILCCAFAGLSFGIVVHFDWALAFGRPIVFLNVAAFAAAIVFRFLAISAARKVNS